MSSFTSVGAAVPLAGVMPAAGDAAQTPAAAHVQRQAFAGELARAMDQSESTSPEGAAAAESETETPSTGTAEGGASAPSATPCATPCPPPGTTANQTPIDALRQLVQRVASPAVPTPGQATKSVEATTRDDSRDDDAPTEQRDAPDAPATPVPHDVARPAHDVRVAAPTVDANTVVRDAGALQPEFRAKLERVVDRMKEEFGRDVTVTETWRGQARQEQLYEQGRTRPGAVVTWTRHSRHSEGRAADLIVGGEAGPEGYRQLARVAADEGLRTLGTRDPGHVELARPSGAAPLPGAARLVEVSGAFAASAAPAAGTASTLAATVTTTGTTAVPNATEHTAATIATNTATIAQVSTVATVATVASVAQVATVAGPGTIFRPTPATRRSTDAGKAQASDRGDAVNDIQREPARPRPAMSAAAVRAAIRTRDTRRPDNATGRVAELPGFGSSDSHRPGTFVADDRGMTRGIVSANGPAGLQGTDTSARIAQVLGLQDARNAQPVSNLLLHLDAPDGGEDRVRIALRGTRVGATMAVGDTAAAAEMSQRLPELSRALEALGLETGDLRVHNVEAGAKATLADLLQTHGADTVASHGTLFAKNDSEFTRQRDDSPGQRAQHESPRHRSRREQKEAKQ